MKNKAVRHILSLVITLLFGLVAYYLTLPALSIHSTSLFVFITVLLGVYNLSYFILSASSFKFFSIYNHRPVFSAGSSKGLFKASLIIVGVFILTGIVGGLTSAKIFNASRYQSMLNVQPGNFEDDVHQVSYDKIPSLDYDSAVVLGNRKMGEMSDFVSQFEVTDRYTQINFQGRPVRVTPLKYVDFIKWLNNTKKGIPGYLRIDMVTQEVTLVRLEEGIKYTPDEHFGKNLTRLLRFKYPTFIFEDETFEIDDNGTPYWICPKLKFTIGLYGGVDIDGAVLVNAVTGESKYYPIDEIPEWVDRVYNAELLIEQYNNYGTLKHGYFNSIFSQRDSQMTTEGYNYIVINDDIYMYTGVTSVASDESNIGFVLINQRTKETKYYAIPGAEEFSAMSSAEGNVQHLGYRAVFPILLNVGGEPTYFIPLKDNSGLVKMYAMVNVKQYQIVATGENIATCEKSYIKLLQQSNIGQTSSLFGEITGKITDIRSAVIEGNTNYFITLDTGEKTYQISAAADSSAVLLNIGDTITVTIRSSDESLSIIPIQKFIKS